MEPRRVALITGAGRGIGRAIAEHLSAAGWAVVVNDNGAEIDGSGGDPAVIERVAAALRESGGEAVAFSGTVGSWDTAMEMAEAARNAFGPVDLLVNNAAILRDRMSFKMSAEEWQQVIDQNLTGAFYCCRAVIPDMRERGTGTIVNMASTTGIFGNISQANYAASKGGMIAMSRVLAQDLQRYNVNVNAITPFAHTRDTERIDPRTPEIQAYFDGAMTVPAEDVGPLIEFLASPAGKSVSGQVLGVRGKEIFVMSQPAVLRSAISPGGWKQDDLAAVFRTWEGALPDLRSDLDHFKYRPFV
jgi:NAD(P)-dependent dehydrogenase (short-subunit alcohol dehydrogenase family)